MMHYRELVREWYPVETQLPEIPEGRFSVPVLCTTNDPIDNVIDARWDGKEFKELVYGCDGTEWHPVYSKVIAWQYWPKPYVGEKI